MKVILYMAMAVNGYIAKEDDNTDFVSEVEWNSFRKMIKQVGNMIVGKRTYEIMQKGGEFRDLGDTVCVVVTHDGSFKISNPHHLVAGSPKEALDLLKTQGFGEALVAGGGMINSSFMREGLVDEIYLDVEPVILGRGIQLFYPEDFESSLEPLEINKLNENLIQLHYRVKK